jgi:enamine deaminase RidA (YjgF/YER057c/UK114 family)
MKAMNHTLPLVAWAVLAASAPALADEIIRYPNGTTFPIAAAVEVPAGKTTLYVSGMTPAVADAKAPPNTFAAYGDTRTQTLSVLGTIKATLERAHLTMGDVVKMQVFLVGDPAKGGHLDFEGLMAAYTQFFGTKEQPNLPARSAMQVVALANPGFLVEIEVVAVRP